MAKIPDQGAAEPPWQAALEKQPRRSGGGGGEGGGDCRPRRVPCVAVDCEGGALAKRGGVGLERIGSWG